MVSACTRRRNPQLRRAHGTLRRAGRPAPAGRLMTKIVTLLIVLAMIAQAIRPFGVPGFRKRADAWKLVLVGIALVLVTAVIRPE